MNTDNGKQIIANILREKNIEPFLDAGLDTKWLDDPEDLSRVAVFGEADLTAYKFLVRYWEDRGKIPSVARFKHSYPEPGYRLPKIPADLDADELVEMAVEDRKRIQCEVDGSDFLERMDAGDHAGAHEAAQKILEHAAAATRWCWCRCRISRPARCGGSAQTVIPGPSKAT